MSQENVDVVRRLFEAVESRDKATVLSLYHPDVELDGSRHRFAEIEPPATYRGHEGVQEFSRLYYGMWESFENHVDELIDAGEHVISVVTTRGRGRASGIDVEWANNVGLWTIREAKVARVVWFATLEDALDAAGLRK